MTTARPTRARRLAMPLAGIMALTLLGTITPPASAGDATGFATSFESGDPSPQFSTEPGGQVNVTGNSYSPGSLLAYLDTVSATAENPPGEVATNLTDVNSQSKWLAFAKTATITYQLTEPVVATQYLLTSANDSAERDPKDFALEGSLDGEVWTTLDEQRGVTFEKRFQQKTFTFENTTAFSYYRLAISANQSGDLIQLADFELNRGPGADDPVLPLVPKVGAGPQSSPTAKANVGFTGMRALQFSGKNVADGPASATSQLYDVNVVVGANSELTYKVFPVFNSDMHYAATYVAVDLSFSDGSRLSTSGTKDSYGFGASARGQGEAKVLATNQWNSVHIDLSAFAGKTVDKVLVTYDNPKAKAQSSMTAWFDDITIDNAVPLDTSDGQVSYVDTRRGSHSTGGFSRGNNLPITAMPNGFNFFTPMTDADSQGSEYSYHQANNKNNKPALEAIGISHEPSIWMGDRNQLAVMPSPLGEPNAARAERALEFDHAGEIARPDLYSVELAGGITAAVTPTDHGAIYRFEYEGETGSVIVDRVWEGAQKFDISADGVLSGWTENGSGGSVGRSRMYFYGEFSATPTKAGEAASGGRPAARVATFDVSDGNPVELRLATSFISADQAKKNHDLELQGVSFADAQAAAIKAWNDRLSVIEVPGASQTQLVTLYSNLYRLNLYPNSQFENTGTADAPVYKYASPVAPHVGDSTDEKTGAAVKDGKIYVNNGFWDTYRTVWPAYSFFYPDLAEELADGFVQQYRDGGWVARWSSPGYADLMTGTSSDVSFAEAYMTGALPTDKALDAYDSALKNATVVSETSGAGRKGIDTSIFLGYTADSTGESVSWGLEGFINDFGIATMAAALAEDPATPAERVDQLEEESEYFFARAEGYTNMFNPEAQFFTPRRLDGSFPQGADFNPTSWWGAFTETNGWNFAFHAPFDVKGLAALYGGGEGLIDKLDEFFATPETSMGSIHEEIEAREVRMGQLGMSNQPSHHIPYMYAAAGEPAKSQEIVREILTRLYVGSDIGQGYFGDEDNGEMSAWYLFSALGFYPLEVGTGNYTIGSPLFDKVIVQRPGERELVISAEGASTEDKKYVAGVELDDQELTSVALNGDDLRKASTLTFSMSASPSTWGMRDLAGETPIDMIDGGDHGTFTAADATLGALQDNNSRSTAQVTDGVGLVWTSHTGPVTLTSYTLTNAADAWPTGWTLEGSNDAETWTQLDRRTDEVFRWKMQTRPFVLAEPATYRYFRIVFDSDVTLGEVELFVGAATDADLELHPSTDVTGRSGVEVSQPLATISGSPDAQPRVTVDFLDGEGPQDAQLSKNELGTWTVVVPHTFAEPGVYDVLVAVDPGPAPKNRLAAGAALTGSARVTITRDTVADMFDMTCIGDRGVGADCDGQGWAFDRALLANNGFVQGTTMEVPGTDLTFDLPANVPGRGDNLTPRGQTIELNLGDGAQQLSVIGTANEKGQTIRATLTYTDRTTQEVEISFGDWVGAAGNPGYGNVVVGSSAGRLRGASGSDGQTAAIFATKPIDLMADKTVESITLPTQEGEIRAGRIHIFAFASDGARVAPAPLALTAASPIATLVGEEFDGTLATASGGDGSPQAATINFGDTTPIQAATITDGAVAGTHTWTEPGTYKVNITLFDKASSTSVEVPVTVSAPAPAYTPSVQVSAPSVAPGASITVTGAGFAAGEQVSVVVPGLLSVQVSADATGAFSTGLTIPPGTADGTYPLTATGAVSATPARGNVVVAEPVVPTPTVTFTPSAGAPGDTVHVTGSDFAAGEQVTVTLGSLTMGTTTADGQGSIAFDMTIPAQAPVGEHVVDVRGVTSGRTAQVSLSVQAGDDPAPTPDPSDDPSVGPDPADGSTPAPVKPDSSPSARGDLPWTGSNSGPILLIGAGVLLAGALAALVAYRARRPQV